MRTSYSAWQDIRHHYEDGDEEDYVPRNYLRCSECGAFLPREPEAKGFDHVMDCYYEHRTCKKCGYRNEEID